MPKIAIAVKILLKIGWVHYSLHGNAADIDSEDESSLLSESDSEDQQWYEGMGFLSIIIIYNLRTL